MKQRCFNCGWEENQAAFNLNDEGQYECRDPYRCFAYGTRDDDWTPVLRSKD